MTTILAKKTGLKAVFTMLFVCFISLLSAQTSTDSTLTNEAIIKQQQADQLKTACPHYPSTQSNQGGMSLPFDVAFKNWTIEFPGEYEAYKTIFNFVDPK